MSDVKPALTADEWDLQLNDYAAMGRPPLPSDLIAEYAVEMAVHDRETTPQERNHAMAAMCLYGQPFGFTHEDVAALREYDRRDVGLYREIAISNILGSLADRIAALLPPEAP